MTNDPLAADFRNFLFLIWQHLNLPEPTNVQYEIAGFMQHGYTGELIGSVEELRETKMYAALLEKDEGGLSYG